jgi:archaellum component FlaC
MILENMTSEVNVLKETCTQLDFKTAIQEEIMGHTRLIHKTRKKIAKCKSSIQDIDTNLKTLESIKFTINS